MSTTEPMTQERLDAIQARVEVATDGPWAVDSDDPSYIIYPEKGGYDGLVIAKVVDQDEALFPVEHNGALIAHAREDIPALLAEVERLRALASSAREVTEEKITEAVYGSMEVNCELRVMENMQTTWCEAHDSEVDAADRCFHVWDIVDPALTTALNGCDDA